MRKKITLLLLLSLSFVYGQKNNTKTTEEKELKNKYLFTTNSKIEDKYGNLITDSIEREKYFTNKQQHIDHYKKSSIAVNQVATQLCSNGNFEEYVNGANILTHFEYGTGDTSNPTQCKSDSYSNFSGINLYNPNNLDIMATTIPSNYIDEYIGNINAFDQYTLKINYKESFETASMVQAKRFKTDNETSVVFNFKAVLQSIFNNSHDNEQPYFKARVINNSGVVVSEFCLIGDPTNCIFTQADVIESDAITLYTPNWQSGILDISSIPNNEEFTIEFYASRCGLGAHFGYAYIDDICLLHTDENLQGSIELDPLYKICPTLPLSVCGEFTIPNSGGLFATVASIKLAVRNENNVEIYSSTTSTLLDLVNKKFCFDIATANLPNLISGTYNVSATINYNFVQTVDCTGTSFNSVTDDDANPGWDIWFLNCTNCDINLQTTSLVICDTNDDGSEIFNLSTANSSVVTNTTGLSFSYFDTLANATNDTNPITTFANYLSASKIIFIRVSNSPTCYKIIAIKLIVKNPAATISGILNICSGNTTLTASTGASYLWANGQITPSISVSTIGTYSVTITDSFGCSSVASVTINGNQVAVNPTIVITQPDCFIATGTITITSPASEYSYNNGLTWSTNSSMSGLNVGSYLVKIRTASGCTSYSNPVTIKPTLSSYPDFNSINPTFCGEVGSITITTVSSSYSFDNGLTWTTSNSMSNLPSGIYKIRVKDAAGCISNYNSVDLNGQFLNDPLVTFENPYCGNLGSITVTTPADSYSFDGGVTWQSSNTLSNLISDTYYVQIRNSQGCTSSNLYVDLTDLETSYPKYTIVNAGCGTYASITITTIADEYSFDGGATWSPNPVALNIPSPLYYNLKVKKGTCVSLTRNIYISSSFLPIPNASDFAIIVCDNLNDGSENIDLSFYNDNLIANATSFNFTYYTTLLAAQNSNFANQITNFTSHNLSNINNTVYVRVTSSDNCFKVVKIVFTFIDSPVITIKDRYPLCEFKTVDIDAGDNYYTYLWSTGETTQIITIDVKGDYWVTVTENNAGLICSTTKNFNIFLSNPATITKIETTDWTNNENTITVSVTGLGIYEYSLDDIHFQDSNQFTNLEHNSYTVYVRDKYNCGEVNEDVFLLMYPYYFTPNGDGFHELWKIKFSENEPGLKTEIFDRNGKFIKVLGSNSLGWDGTYNGNMMIADDYWFVVTRPNGKIHKGHFTLKR